MSKLTDQVLKEINLNVFNRQVEFDELKKALALHESKILQLIEDEIRIRKNKKEDHRRSFCPCPSSGKCATAMDKLLDIEEALSSLKEKITESEEVKLVKSHKKFAPKSLEITEGKN